MAKLFFRHINGYNIQWEVILLNLNENLKIQIIKPAKMRKAAELIELRFNFELFKFKGGKKDRNHKKSKN